MGFNVYIKSGTNNYFDYDGVDLYVAEIESSNIPKKDDILIIYREGKEEKYLVRQIERHYNLKGKKLMGEDISVYVIST